MARLSRAAGPPAHSEQARAEVVVRSAHAGQREEVAAAGRLDVVHQWLSRQPALHDLELPGHVLLVAAEDQAHVEVAHVVEAAVIVVAATQDPRGRGRGGPGVGQPDMRVSGMTRPFGSAL